MTPKYQKHPEVLFLWTPTTRVHYMLRVSAGRSHARCRRLNEHNKA